MSPNIKQPETPRRVLECCTNAISASNAHTSRKLTYLNTSAEMPDLPLRGNDTTYGTYVLVHDLVITQTTEHMR